MDLTLLTLWFLGIHRKGTFFGEQVLNPLFESLGQSIGDEYWLLDSGASCCVVNQTTLENFQHDDLVSCGATFTAASQSERFWVFLRIQRRLLTV